MATLLETPAQRLPSPRRGTMRASLLSVGTSLPIRVETNQNLALEYGLSEDWISRRCGFERRLVAGEESAISLGATAALEATVAAMAKPDLLLCATYSPDVLLAPIAPAIAHRAGLGSIAAFDINAACTGGLTALLTGIAYITAGVFHRVLVVATDTTTKHLDDRDLKTRMLFSDGAAAILLGEAAGKSVTLQVRSHVLGSDGSGLGLFSAPWTEAAGGRPRARMDGPALFRFAVETGARVFERLCNEAGIDPSQLTRVLLHQANRRITRAIQQAVSSPPERWPETPHIGNLAGASLLFLLAEEFRRGALIPGELMALIAFGAGLCWAGSIVEVVQ
jgi:3-oxoacyl-[acyl-carrier-protein] synthase III